MFMKNRNREILNIFVSFCLIVIYGFIFWQILYNGVIYYSISEIFGVLFILVLSINKFKFSIGYLCRYFTYRRKIDNPDYYIESKKKYNKFGSFYLNRPVLVDGDNYSKGNWSLDVEKREKNDIPLKCKTDGVNYIIL